MASLIGEHATDAGRHRSHCQLAPGAGSPVQLAVTVSVSPSRGVPTIAGAPVITGTVAVCADATTGTRQASAIATAVMTSGRIAADLLRTEHPQPLQPTPPRSAHPLVKRLGQHCDTANFAQLELNDSRGTATPMQVHHEEDETFYVLEGEIVALVGDERVTLSAGDYAFAPRGIAHTTVVSSERARVLVTASPAGLEQLFVSLGSAVSESEPPAEEVLPPIDELVRRFAAYGVDIVGPRLRSATSASSSRGHSPVDLRTALRPGRTLWPLARRQRPLRTGAGTPNRACPGLLERALLLARSPLPMAGSGDAASLMARSAQPLRARSRA